MKFIPLLSLLLLFSCANLYKERAYVTNVENFKKIKGECKSGGSQNKFVLDTRKGPVHFSTPVHYDYWWTGPVVIPMFPLNKERRDPSFIKMTVMAKEEILDHDELLKSEILIPKKTDPILPMNAVFSTEKNMEKYVIQFDSPELVDLKHFKLKLPDTLTSEKLEFDLEHDTHYVPIVPVTTTDCVTD